MTNEASSMILLIVRQIVQQCSATSYKTMRIFDWLFLVTWSDNQGSKKHTEQDLCSEFQNIEIESTVNRLNNT